MATEEFASFAVEPAGGGEPGSTPPEVRSFNIEPELHTRGKRAPPPYPWYLLVVSACGVMSVALGLGALAVPLPPRAMDQVQQVVAGPSSACEVSYGKVFCWGYNAHGQLGLGDTKDRGTKSMPHDGEVPIGFQIHGVAVGGGRACAWDGAHPTLGLKCWGDNTNALLGLGDALTRGSEPGQMGFILDPVPTSSWDGGGFSVLKVCAGNYHTCALGQSGNVRCWGMPSTEAPGILGYGDDKPRGRGDPGDPSELAHLAPLALGAPATDLSCGASHTCAVIQRSDGHRVTCWGSYRSILVPRSSVLGLGTSASVGELPSHMGDNLRVVDLGSQGRPASIWSGRAANCAIFHDGRAKCWGHNRNGELGYGDRVRRGSAADPPMGDRHPFLDLGANETAQAFAMGSFHTCVLLRSLSVKCWGSGEDGALGNGATSNVGHLPNQMGENLRPVDLGGVPAVSLAAGTDFTCALLANVGRRCWGSNGYGQLGTGNWRYTSLPAAWSPL